MEIILPTFFLTRKCSSINSSPHPHHQETPPLTSLCWHSPTQTLDVLVTQATLRHHQEFPYFSLPSSPFTAPTLTQVMNPWKGKEPEKSPLPKNNCRGGTLETHAGMKALMTETLVTLSRLQLKFHLTIEQLQLQEALIDRDWLLEADLVAKAMDRLSRFQFYQNLHHTQYWLAEHLPLPWDDLPVVQILTPENWSNTQMPSSSGTPSPR